MGNENWTMFAVMFTSTIVFAVLSVMTMKENQ